MADYSYWGGNGKFQDLADKMQSMVPVSGPCYNIPDDDTSGINKPLDTFRQVVNAYYDIFNNGGGNNDTRKVSKFFPGVMQHLRGRNFHNPDWDTISSKANALMDKHVQRAAKSMDLL